MRRGLLTTVIVGAVIGALNLLHYYTTREMSGVKTPFGLFPGGFPVAVFLGLAGKKLSADLIAMLVLGGGILGGAFMNAKLSGELTGKKFRAQKLSKNKAFRAGVGGVLMGAGTWMAQGCLVKHTLSGAPGLMLSSFVTLGGIVVGIWLCVIVEERWGG